MAIYQFGFTVIPKSVVLEKYSQVPERLHIDNEAWEEYYQQLDFDKMEETPGFEDALTYHWWKFSKVKAETIIQVVDSIAKRAFWSNSEDSITWKNEGEDIADEDVYLGFDTQSNLIKEFAFRIDLRFGVNKFLLTLIELCVKYDLLLMDKRGNLIEPRIESISHLVSTSNAHRFVSNPSQFFNDLDKGANKIE
jgi:hypothetical protein